MPIAAEAAPSEDIYDDGRIVALDAQWQHPAITERHAFEQVRRASSLIPPGVGYLGFPWATLIDLLDQNPGAAAPLQKSLAELAARLVGKARVVTVCQHIRLPRHQRLFHDSGVTDIFWSHAAEGLGGLPNHPSIRLRPFPLYPVQVPEGQAPTAAPRDIVFSFVGARAKDFYLSQARNHILDLLSEDPRGYVRGRSDWHYNRIVYDHQIRGKAPDADGLVDAEASLEFKDVLARSVFSLCPSGSGPNSIRLWESIGAGSIPVILADTYIPPGDAALWREAAVFCREDPAEIAALPARLAAMAEDAALLARKRHALAQLWRLYGPDSFVYDLKLLFIADAAAGVMDPAAPLPLRFEQLLTQAEKLQAGAAVDLAHADILLAACASRLLLDPPGFAAQWTETPALGEACAKLVERAPDRPAARSYGAALRRFAASTERANAAPRRPPPRICLFGANANRTPVYYSAYAPLLQGRLDRTSLPETADILLFGASPNIINSAEELGALVKALPSLSLAVLSEEPLWDTTWALDWGRRAGRLETSDVGVDYAILSHATSDIFAFEKIPYYVTTSDDFLVRYAEQFRRNAALSPEAVLDAWRRAPIRAAFFAERRREPKYDFSEPAQDLEGLCAYRTRVAEAVSGEGVLRVGKGWRDGAPRRQDLPDWHLDKLATLDRKAFVVSGLENTHFPDYITEKLFDAFAVLGAPIYYASPRHRIHEIVPETSYINVYGQSAEQAAETIRAFEPDRAFATAYLDAQRRLAELFSDPRTMMRERARVARAVVRALDAAIDRPEMSSAGDPGALVPPPAGS